MSIKSARLHALAGTVATALAAGAVFASPALAHKQYGKVTVSGNKITVTGKVKEPVDKAPISIMIFDSHGVSALDSKACDAKPGADGEMPWVIHTTKKLTPPGSYSVEFVWFAHNKMSHRTQYFKVKY